MRKIFPVVAAGATALVMAGASFAYAVQGKDVRLTVDGASRDVTTVAGTVGQVLDKQGIEVGPHDLVAPDPGTRLTDGNLDRRPVRTSGHRHRRRLPADLLDHRDHRRAGAGGAADRGRRRRRPLHQPSSSIGREGLTLTVSTEKAVTLDDAGKKRRLTTNAATVGDALLDAGVTVDADDQVRPAATLPLTDGAKIRYTRVDTKRVTKKSKVAYDTTYQKSKKLDQGQTEVKRKGVAGVRTTVSTQVRHNGELVSTKKTSSRVTTKPKNAVVLRGTKEVRSVLRGGEPADVGDGGGSRSQIFTTGYTYWDNSPPGSAQIARPIVHDRAAGTGTWKDPITVAVRAGRFDFGTRFYLPELKKYFVVEDLCGACNDGRNGGAYTLDLWVDGSHLSSAGAAQCASRVTRVQPAIEDPDSDLPVDRGSVC